MARRTDDLSPTIGRSSDGADCAVTIHAVLPPPVTGMTLCTASMAEAISRKIPVRQTNWSNGSATITSWFRVAKAGRAMLSPLKLLFSRRPTNAVFYMPVNGGWALFFNLMSVAAARLRGYRCAVHHHIYRYLERFDWRLQLLDRLLGSTGLHIVLCRDMERRLRERYACRAGVAIVPSTVQLLQTEIANMSVDQPVATPVDRFRIGHITNLQIAKGLDVVIEVLRVLRARGRNVQLVLAGPVHSKLEQRLIDDAREKFGEHFDYRGPVYHADKQRFFRDIHVKLYPTRNDAQPLVINEAFAFGRPVISYGRGCIPGMIGPSLDWSIPITDDFVPKAVDLIERWMDEPADYVSACRAARERFDSMLDEARDALEKFIEWVSGEPDRGFVQRGFSSELNKLCEAS
ncbi:MAG TPA: glycosyltransferase family 4 protein [Lacipirellulaceae bacterium]